jgi:type IV pilus assembly protein PilA
VLTRIRKATEDKEQGFTLIELLVVIIIIGILAAIAIPTFLRQREKGWDAASKAEAKNIATAQESLFTDTGAFVAVANNASAAILDGTPPGALKAEGYNISEPFANKAAGAQGSVLVTVTGNTYCISVAHKNQPAVFWNLGNTGVNAGSPTRGTSAACT